ncbi:MAG: hypothetical protein Q8S26_06250 [Azonexus sp.]|nr:hypothetical protein [Azonexus sp.]
MAGFEGLIFSGLNHLLDGEPWAQERLRPLAGAQALIESGPLSLHLRIDEYGRFVAGDKGFSPDVIVTLPADAPIKFLLDREGLLSSVKLSGSVDLAEALAFVFRNLSWDVEADLAGVIGDIPARRLSTFGGKLGVQLQAGANRLAENLVEYSTEDSDLLVPNRDVEAFGKEVNILRDDLARLEKRVSRLQ